MRFCLLLRGPNHTWIPSKHHTWIPSKLPTEPPVPLPREPPNHEPDPSNPEEVQATLDREHDWYTSFTLCRGYTLSSRVMFPICELISLLIHFQGISIGFHYKAFTKSPPICISSHRARMEAISRSPGLGKPRSQLPYQAVSCIEAFFCTHITMRLIST